MEFSAPLAVVVDYANMIVTERVRNDDPRCVFMFASGYARANIICKWKINSNRARGRRHDRRECRRFVCAKVVELLIHITITLGFTRI